MESLSSALTAELVPIVVSLLGLLGTWVLNELRRKIKTERHAKLFDSLRGAAEVAVRDLEQTLVPEIKAAAKDGKITEAERAKLQRIAVERTKRNLGTMTKDLRAVVGTEVDHVIRSYVESHVNGMTRFVDLAEPVDRVIEKLDEEGSK